MHSPQLWVGDRRRIGLVLDGERLSSAGACAEVDGLDEGAVHLKHAYIHMPMHTNMHIYMHMHMCTYISAQARAELDSLDEGRSHATLRNDLQQWHVWTCDMQ